jgi:hypothetical protein
MVMIVLAVLINLAAPASAQNTLQLPDVILFGEYTLYLAAPAPKGLEIPAATGLTAQRFSHERSHYKINLGLPEPPNIYWQRIPRSRLAPPGLLSDLQPGRSLGEIELRQTYPATSWHSTIAYIPGTIVAAELAAATRISSVWEVSTDLGFDLADGWLASPPDLPTDLLFGAQAHRRAQILNIDAAVGAGAFFDVSSSALYTLSAAVGFFGKSGIFQFREETRGIGMSGIPGSPESQRGGVQQELALALIGSRLEVSLHAAGVLTAELPSGEVQQHGSVTAELGWRHPESTLHLWAGAAALYHLDSFSIHPSGGLELYPADLLSLRLVAAPFVRLPAQWELHASLVDSGLPQLEAEGGYSLLTELRLDPYSTFWAMFSFEWRRGRFYFLEAEAPGLVFAATNQGILEGNLNWQIRPARPGIRLNLSAELAAPFPLSIPPSWGNLLYKNAGLVWTTDFHKLPVEFIIKSLIGDYADDGSLPFLFTDREIVSGLVTSIEANWRVGKHGTIHTGFEAFFNPTFSYRYLIGYGIRR